MKDCKPATDTQGVEDGLKALINAQLLLGKEVLSLLTGAGGGVLDKLGGLKLPGRDGCCKVPEPCWMPLGLGAVRCQLKPGDSGTVCLVVTNGDFRPHNYQFAATGKSAAFVAFSQAGAVLGPKERIAVTATFTVPTDRQDGPEDCRCIDHDVLLWVRGCRNHYLRWSIDEVAQGKACCHEIEVADDPDYVLHWYDHFYIARPCPGVAPQGSTGAPAPVGVHQ